MNRKIIRAAATMLMLTHGSALAPVAHADPIVSNPQPVGPTGQTYTLVFQDEFNGSSLDLTKWSNSWFNGAVQNRVPTSAANVAVSGGNVTLTLTGTPGNYVGASINTDPLQNRLGGGFTFTTGVTEWRVKFPGNGTNHYNWPAVWQSTDVGGAQPYLGEIDSAEPMNTVSMHYHYATYTPNFTDYNPLLYDAGYVGNDFHTYTMQRTTTNILMWLDGVQIVNYVVQGGYPVSTPQFLVANIGAGLSEFGATETMTGPAGAVVIDYVRVWSVS